MPGIVMDPLNIAANIVGNVSTAKSHREKVSAAEAVVREVLSFASRFEVLSSEQTLVVQLENPACQKADKEAILLGVGAFLKSLWISNDIAGTAALFPAIPYMLDTIGDKNASLKEAALYAMEGISGFLRDSGSELDEVLVGEFASQFISFLKGKNAKDAGVVVALKCISQLVAKALEEEEGVLRKQMTRDLEAYFVAVEGYLHHLKAVVSKQATKTLKDLTQLIENTDIKKHIPKLVDTLKAPTMQNLQSAVHDLCQTTFIQPVLADLLALVAPILERTLAMPQMPQDYIRDTVVVVENLAKLVFNPLDAKQFLPRLLPGIDKAKEYSAIPQVREVAATASGTVRKVLGHVGEDLTLEGVTNEITSVLNAKAPSYLAGDNLAAWNLAVRDMASRAVKLAFESEELKRIPKVVELLLSNPKSKSSEIPFLEIGQAVSDDLSKKYNVKIEAEEEDEGVEIVNSVFSLAYGGMLLLNHSTMRLLKGHRYGVCGKNGAGKSTLMRAIAEGSLEGFPTKEELKRCFVEFKAEDKLQTVKEYMVNQLKEEGFEAVANDDARVTKVLEELGFEGERLELDVNSLSGGWKMKLSLGKAILMEADVLLLDEPTNHLDTANVSWLQNYLVTHTEITSLIISHDRDFLDFVCTDIINYENKKLVYYKGNLAEFIKRNASAAAFTSLDAGESKFNFPDPGILTGVKSTTRAIMKMSNVTFTYPGRKEPSLRNATCAITLSSRVGIKGANGAGKSTLIRILMGELIPQTGTVEKHPNLRIGYVAQHSLKHVEMHLEKSPLQYLIWRYENGDDREANMKATRVFTDEDLIQMETMLEMGNGKGKGQIECIVGRQKSKKSFQYEIKWKNFLPRWNTRISRETLLEKGFAKLVQEFDDKESAREGLGFRELKPDIIRKHFEDVGLDPDIAEHNEIGGLSGGQKVKVVIAAAMWVKPHVLILDEPTNFLDRDTLGGLSHAIKGFKGGVVMISHHEEFMQTLMNDFWLVENFTVTTSKLLTPADALRGAATPIDSAASSDAGGDSDMSFKTKAPKKKKLTRAQVKDQQVRRRLRYLEWLQSPKGTPMPKDSDDES